MENSHRFIARVVIALGLLGASGCGSQVSPTPSPSPTQAVVPTRTIAPTLSRPTDTPAPLPSPTVVLPTTVPAPPATSAPTGSGCTNRYAFVADVSIPDGTSMPAAQVFTKTWRVRNTGTCTWSDGYILVFEKGNAMTTIPSIAVPRTPPGAEAELSVLLTAPAPPGAYEAFWVLKNPQGISVPPSLWVKIVVTGG